MRSVFGPNETVVLLHSEHVAHARAKTSLDQRLEITVKISTSTLGPKWLQKFVAQAEFLHAVPLMPVDRVVANVTQLSTQRDTKTAASFEFWKNEFFGNNDKK